MKRCVGIRADGNMTVGMGHVMRCRTIAMALAGENISVLFFVADESTAVIVKEWGFPVVVLHSDYAKMEEELSVLQKELLQNQVDVLLVDSYFVTQTYLKAVREITKVYLMDDMGREAFLVDGLINYNIYGKMLPYEQLYEKNVKLLLGTEYAPVRPEFFEKDYKPGDNGFRILITMGGSDSLHIAKDLTEKLLESQTDFELKVVCGVFCASYPKLQQLAEKEKRLSVYTNVKDMASLMRECDLAVAAAGTTLYELCAVGVPTITCFYVDNQEKAAKSFGTQTKIYNAGDWRENSQEVLSRIVEKIDLLMHDRKLLKEISENMRQMVDGKGAKRIAEEIIKAWD